LTGLCLALTVFDWALPGFDWALIFNFLKEIETQLSAPLKHAQKKFIQFTNKN